MVIILNPAQIQNHLRSNIFPPKIHTTEILDINNNNDNNNNNGLMMIMMYIIIKTVKL